MKNAYPIKIQQSGEFYVVYIPDFDANTQGTTIAEAMEMARDAIGMLGCYLQDEKRQTETELASRTFHNVFARQVTVLYT